MRLYKRWHRPIAKRFIKLPLLHIESKKNGNVSEKINRSVFFLWPPTEMTTYGNEVISVGGHKKSTDRPTKELFTPFEALFKTCL